jgi:hypothetical protein
MLALPANSGLLPGPSTPAEKTDPFVTSFNKSRERGMIADIALIIVITATFAQFIHTNGANER